MFSRIRNWISRDIVEPEVLRLDKEEEELIHTFYTAGTEVSHVAMALNRSPARIKYEYKKLGSGGIKGALLVSEAN